MKNFTFIIVFLIKNIKVILPFALMLFQIFYFKNLVNLNFLLVNYFHCLFLVKIFSIYHFLRAIILIY